MVEIHMNQEIKLCAKVVEVEWMSFWHRFFMLNQRSSHSIAISADIYRNCDFVELAQPLKVE